MFNEISKHPLLFVVSILFHVLLAGLLIFSFDIQHPMPTPEKVEVVQAKVVDESLIQKELQKLEQAEQKKKQQETEQQKRLDEQKRKAEEAKRKRQAEERRLKEAEAKRKREQDAARKAEEKRKEAERQRKEQEKAKRQAEAEAEKKRLAAEAEAEKKRLAAEVEAEKKRLAAEAEAEKKRLAEEAKKKRLAEEAAEAERRRRNEQLQAERDAIAAEITQGVVDEYQLKIKEQVERKWRKPPNITEDLSCDVLVKLIPGGMVRDVTIIKSSGNAVFDRSVEVAVRSAEPLPLPSDASMFEHFREIRFVFDPE